MKFKILTALLLASTALHAQDSGLLNLSLEARVDFQQEMISGSTVNDNSGFKGKYLNLRMDGSFNDQFSYSFRQRLNKPLNNASFFDATDWITLTYTNNNWSISGGKQVVAIGGFEYDRAPIDLYFCSEYWNNIACYQMGASVGYTFGEQNDKLIFQFCESPFRRNAANTLNKEMFAYNLIWYGTHGWFESMYSLNMLECMPGRYINYVVAGNRFKFGQFRLDLDIMARTVSMKEFGKDMSVMGEFAWTPMDKLNIFLRASHDRNLSNTAGDFCVLPGTEITRVGGGIEYYPLKNSKNIRLHLNCCYNSGINAGVLKPEQTIIDAGLTWKMNLLNIRRKNQ